MNPPGVSTGAPTTPLRCSRPQFECWHHTDAGHAKTRVTDITRDPTLPAVVIPDGAHMFDKQATEQRNTEIRTFPRRPEKPGARRVAAPLISSYARLRLAGVAPLVTCGSRAAIESTFVPYGQGWQF